MNRNSAGFQLIEIVVVLALVGIFSTIGLPYYWNASLSLELSQASAEVLSALRLARATAVREGVKVGVKLRPTKDGDFTFTLYRDGDADGVRTRDIETEVDPPVGPARHLHHLGRRIHLGFPQGPAPRDPGNPRRRLPPDPVRFNRSDIASFGPLGGSTPGSIYLTDGRSRLAAVRVFGRTGKIKVIYYDVRSETWNE